MPTPRRRQTIRRCMEKREAVGLSLTIARRPQTGSAVNVIVPHGQDPKGHQRIFLDDIG